MSNRVANVLAAATLLLTVPVSAGEGASETIQSIKADSKVTIPVQGLTCASCSINVRRALKKMDGIKSIEPGTHENEAIVTYDAAKVTPQQMVDAIAKAGFTAGTPIKG